MSLKNPNVALVLNATKPDEMSQRFRDMYTEIDERAKITNVNLGVGFSRLIPATTDEILFTGGTREQLSKNPELAEEIKRLFQQVGEPMMGVCFGAQVVARQHGLRLVKLAGKRTGANTIEVVVSGNPYLDQYAGSIRTAEESHLWTMPVEGFPEELDVLGQSQDGVEIFAHQNLPQGGVQFHPEHGIGENDGVILFDGLRKTVLDKKPKQ